MRNVFDQYDQPENKLTHALATVLREEPDLLREFIFNATGRRLGKRAKLEILEQSLPGQDIYEIEEGDSGLPDMWIYDDDTWCLLVESKISDSLKETQLQRHYSTAERRGFTDIDLLAIDAKQLSINLPDFAAHTTWTEIYSWLNTHAYTNSWAKHASEYFEIAEQKFVQKGYLREGKLTVFTGIPFGRNHPYNYPEAKRLLGLIMDELRQEHALASELGLDLDSAGRAAIRGSHGISVWDYMGFTKAKSSERFNKYPHVTILVAHDRVRAALMIPDKLNKPMRKRLENLSYEDFRGMLEQVVTNTRKLQKHEPAAQPKMSVVQRHFPIPYKPVVDGSVEFDLRTAFPADGEKIKLQEEWIESAWEAIVNKNSNIEASLGIAFPYEFCEKLDNQQAIQLLVGAWLATKPFSDFLFNR